MCCFRFMADSNGFVVGGGCVCCFGFVAIQGLWFWWWLLIVDCGLGVVAIVVVTVDGVIGCGVCFGC